MSFRLQPAPPARLNRCQLFGPGSRTQLFAKMAAILFLFLWFRATFPRYRYDQLMRLGWKVFLPICLIWLVVIGVWMMSPLNIWK